MLDSDAQAKNNSREWVSTVKGAWMKDEGCGGWSVGVSPNFAQGALEVVSRRYQSTAQVDLLE